MKCYKCGKDFVPAPFNRDNNDKPFLENLPSYAAGQISDLGEVWVACPDWHYGQWIKDKVEKA